MFQQILEQIAEGLQSRAIPYMVIGGQAVLLYGESRFTQDIDVTLGIGIERLPEVLNFITEKQWKLLVSSPEEFVRKTMVLPCQEPCWGIRVDLIFSFSPYEHQAIGRARKVKLAEIEVAYASPEDLILHKLIAGRPRDLEDIKIILAKNSALDLSYVSNWLGQFEEALQQPLLKLWQQMIKN